MYYLKIFSLFFLNILVALSWVIVISVCLSNYHINDWYYTILGLTIYLILSWNSRYERGI